MPVVELEGTEIAYEVLGDAGDPLVLVHGSWVDHATFGAVVPVLAQSFRVLTYDLRGHGRSGRTFGAHPVDDHVRDLAGLLRATDLYPAHVAGNSLGAAVAVQLAAERPDLFRSLIAHDAPLVGMLAGAEPPELLDAVARMDAIRDVAALGDARGAAQRFVELVGRSPGAWPRLPPAVQELYVAHAAAWLAEYEDSRTLAVDPARLAEFDPPALLTTGETSPLFFGLIAARLAAILPNVHSVVLPGAGHVPHLTHPGLFVGLLTSFLLERTIPTA